MGSVSPSPLGISLAAAAGPPVIVIADSDAALRDAVRGFMSARGYRVEPAADAGSAVELLRSRPIDVLVSDAALRGADGTELLTLARSSAPHTPRIAIATARDRDAALRSSALRVLDKPLSLLELADAVSLAQDCAHGFHGWMHRMSLIDMLQLYHQAGASLVLHVRGAVDGWIALRRGELIHAQRGDELGMPALIALLTLSRGVLETAALGQVPRTISGPFDHVLLDGLRALDEACRPEAPAETASSTTFELDLVEPAPPARWDRAALAAWLADNAPSARVWHIDPAAAVIERVAPGGDPGGDPGLASPPGVLGWALELAELGDPTWTRVELTWDDTAIALLRVAGVVIALVHAAAGEATLGRFRLDSARLLRWLSHHVERAP